MKSDQVKNTLVLFILCSIIGYFLYLMVPWLHNNLWNDEIYTLKKFTFVSLRQTVTDYHVPNNHILYNLFDSLYLRLLGIHDMHTVMEAPWILRLPLLLLSVVTLLLLYECGRLAGGRLAGLLAAGILATTIPFQNFCLQVRGYEFSIFFDLLLLYYCLSYLRRRKLKYLIGIALSSFAAIYTIPSDLYCIISLIAFWGLLCLYRSVHEKKLSTAALIPLLAIVLGTLIAVCCYMPVLKEVFTNDYVRSSSGPFHFSSFKIGIRFYQSLIAGRIPLFIFFGLCSIIYFLKTGAPHIEGDNIWMLVSLQIVVPACMIVARGESPPDRIFIYLCPFVALLMAVTIAWVLVRTLPAQLHTIAVVIILLWAIVACQRDRSSIDQAMLINIQRGYSPQDVRMDYYLHFFYPLRVTHYLSAHQDGIPLVLKSSEDHDMPDYLRAYHVSFHPRDSLGYFIGMRRPIYVITTGVTDFDGAYSASHSYKVTEIMPPSYHHLMRLEPMGIDSL